MIRCLANNIISPLGEGTAVNYEAVKAGRSALRRYSQRWGLQEPFAASLFSDEQTETLSVEGLTRFESLAFRSASKAVEHAGIDVTDSRTVFILSTTKANIELLKDSNTDVDAVGPSTAAAHIAARLGVITEPIVVCNACISGVAALVLALRLLETRQYDYAIVCGADVQSKFTVSGFQSLKAVSGEECRPFDLERLGLNLGEGAATMIVARPEIASTELPAWFIERGAIRNDAFHISSPSKDGEGAFLAIKSVLEDISELSFINAHGTATMFNDQMESVAIERAGLSDVPVNGLKGVFGHTLGAAGLIETIISMAAIDDGTVLGTKGFQEKGVSGKIILSAENTASPKTAFIKMISGFGGGNATLLVRKKRATPFLPEKELPEESFQTVHRLLLTPTSLTIDGCDIQIQETGALLLTWLYKTFIGDYPKYYKMDGLCRLGLIATELLLGKEARNRFTSCEDRAITLMNHSSSISADRKYLESIADKDNYFPSPSVFVYTLPNIVTGEIAMRNNYHGETSFYITERRDDYLIQQVVEASFADFKTKSVIGGWIDYLDDNHYEADIFIKVKVKSEECNTAMKY